MSAPNKSYDPKQVSPLGAEAVDAAVAAALADIAGRHGLDAVIATPGFNVRKPLLQYSDAEAAAGISLTESMAMWPGASVSGVYYSHPEAQYFVVGRLSRDQIADYAERKGWSVTEAEKWLSPNLGYDPDD
mgnify:CR=1 FL=1